MIDPRLAIFAMETPKNTAPLYTLAAARDPERTSGSTPSYSSFADFITTFHEEANDPAKVGAADILDLVNPLQHLPVVGTLYRHMTGDMLKPGSQIIGGAVFGGGAGLAASSVSAAIKDKTGLDMGDTVIASLTEQSPVTARPSSTPALALAPQEAAHPEPKTQPNSSDLPVFPVVITWNESPHTSVSIPTQTLLSAYRPTGNGTSSTAPLQRVSMTDPERTAGSFTAYV